MGNGIANYSTNYVLKSQNSVLGNESAVFLLP